MDGGSWVNREDREVIAGTIGHFGGELYLNMPPLRSLVVFAIGDADGSVIENHGFLNVVLEVGRALCGRDFGVDADWVRLIGIGFYSIFAS